MKLIPGYDYTVIHGNEVGEVERTRREWQEHIRACIAKGGYRRTENGETYLHERNTRIIMEIYANIHV